VNRVRMTLRTRWFAALLSPALLVACVREPLPDIVLVTFDTTRYDRLGASGDARAQTPTLDALAARGVLFERAYASVPLTLPSHTTILSGLEPFAHGVRDNGRFRVPDEIELLSEILGAAGYDTGAFVSAFVLDPRFNLDQGFAVYGSETRRTSGPLDMTVPQRPAAEVTDEALAWLADRPASAPIFVWTHYYDPHLPRRVEPPFDQIRDEYRAEIAYADAQLGRLLEGIEAVRAGRPTLIVFTSDHGEALGEHSEATHGLLAYDATLHVPLVIAGPGVDPGRSAQRVGHVDIVPTILAAVGLPVPEPLAGRDLLAETRRGLAGRALAAFRSGSERPDLGYFESLGTHLSLGWAPLRGVRTSRWKYTAEPSPVELYDVQEDPSETRNLADERPEVRDEFARLYDQLLASQPARAAEPRELDADEAHQLAALGYLDAAVPDVASGAGFDPRQFVAAHGWVGRARTLAEEGEYARAIDLLETLAEAPAVKSLALRTLAPVYAEAGRRDDAVDAYRRYLELTGAPEARLGLARTLLDGGEPEQALAELDRLDAATPGSKILRAFALQSLGRIDEAVRLVDETFAGPHEQTTRLRTRARLVLRAAPAPDIEPQLRKLLQDAADDPVLRSHLGSYLAKWGGEARREEALELLRSAASEEPNSAELQSNLGWGLAQLGVASEARRAFDATLRLDPARQADRVRLARVLASLGETDEALALVRRALAGRPAAPWSDEARSLEARLEEAQRSSSADREGA